MTENGAFKLRSDIHTPTAPSCVAAISVSRLRNHERQQHTNLHNLPHSKLTVKEKQTDITTLKEKPN